MPPRALFELRHSLNPATLTVPADGIHPEYTVHATGHPLNWAVATTDGMAIELNEYIYNWRLTIAHQHTPLALEGGWCYFGLAWESFCTAVRAAATFTPATQSAPAGYGKEVLSWTPPATSTERSTP